MRLLLMSRSQELFELMLQEGVGAQTDPKEFRKFRVWSLGFRV